MRPTNGTLDENLAPIISDWTIRDLLEWLSDDAHVYDDALRGPLSTIDLALTGTPWHGQPSTVALIRSIASTVHASPRIRNMRLDDLIDFRIVRLVDEPGAKPPVARFESVPVPQLV